jgi:putative glutamine amidotransferase
MAKHIVAYVLDGAGSEDVKVWVRNFVGAELATAIEDANLIVFTGGADVNPTIYGETNVASGVDLVRDATETDIFDYAISAGIPMLGICRGSQFLHAMKDGKLWQHIEGHAGVFHDLRDRDDGTIIPNTCSTHHQMVRMEWTNGKSAATNGFELMAEPREPISPVFVCADGPIYSTAEKPITEVEGYRYRKDNIIGIQGHPEWGGDEFSVWAAQKVIDFLAEPRMGIEREGLIVPEVIKQGAARIGAGCC